MNAPKTVKLVAKTAVGMDVSPEYKKETGKDKKPWWMTQRIISIVIGVLCSTVLAKLELDSKELTVIVMAVIDNKEAFSAVFGIFGMMIVFVKGWVNKRKRNTSQVPENHPPVVNTSPAESVPVEEESGHGINDLKPSD